MNKRNIYTKNDVGLTFLLCVLLPQIVGTIFVFGLVFVASLLNTNYESLTKHPLVLLCLTCVAQFVFVGIFFIFNRTKKINYMQACKVNFNVGWKNILISILIGLVCLFGFNNLINSFDHILSLLGHTSAPMPLPLNSFSWLVANLVFLAVLPAIFEELLFRGIILNGLKQYGKVKAVIFSALLFALMHGSIDQTLYPILLGIVFGFVAIKTNSVVPTIIMHFINNSTVIIINYISTITSSVQTLLIDWKYIVVSIVIAIASAVVIYFLTKLLKPKANKIQSYNESDLQILENSKNKPNTMLFFAVAVASVIWLLSLIA